MKLIKKLTVIDWLVLFLVALSAVIGLVFFSRRKAEVYVRTVSIVSIWPGNSDSPPYWLANTIRKGDVAYNSLGQEVAQVIEVDNTERGGQKRYLYLTLKVRAVFDKRTKLFRINDQIVSVGNNLPLDIGNTKFQGVITYVGDSPDVPDTEEKKLKLFLKVREVEPDVAKTYNNSFSVTNTNGEEEFRILSAQIKLHEAAVPNDAGQLVVTVNPLMRDVLVEAEVKTTCQEEVCYFQEVQPMKVGASIQVQTERSIISNAEILGVEEVNDI